MFKKNVKGTVPLMGPTVKDVEHAVPQVFVPFDVGGVGYAKKKKKEQGF